MREWFSKLFLAMSLSCMTEGKRAAFLSVLETETEHQTRIKREWVRINEEQAKIMKMIEALTASAEAKGVELPDYSKYH